MDAIYEFYKNQGLADSNTVTYEAVFKNPVPRPDMKIIKKNGYEYIVPDFSLFRVNRWFNKKITDDLLFISFFDVMAKYAQIFYGGILEYKLHTKRIFIMNRRNFALIKSEHPSLHKTISDFFNHELTAADKRNSETFFVSAIEKKSLGDYLECQKKIFKAICKTFNVSGTYLPHMRSIYYTSDQQPEFMFKSSALSIIKNSPYNWFNSGLTIPAIKFNPGPTFNNYRFKAVRFLNAPHQISPEYFLITYNVHQFISPNTMTLNVAEKTLAIVKRAQIVVLQEMAINYLPYFIKHFKTHLLIENGNTYLFAGSTVPAKMSEIRWRDRNSILIETADHRIIGTHLEIGERFIFSNKLLQQEEFARIYAKNVKLRSEAIGHLLQYKPDIVCGDMNFQPISPEIKLFSNYQYTPLDDTTYHGGQVDYIFTKKPYQSERIVTEVLSDHYPVGLLKPKTGSHETPDPTFLVILFIVIFALAKKIYASAKASFAGF